MNNYKLYIDFTGGKNTDGFFEIGVIKLDEMPSDYVNGNPRVERYGFGDIEIKNEPYKYAKLGGDRYRLYDIIKSTEPDQEIWLRFISDYETRYAYFGVIDCSLSDDKNNIKIKPYILDPYTELIENSDTEVKLFDETNQIVNGDFKEWSGDAPVGWNPTDVIGNIHPNRSFYKDKSAAALPKTWVGLVGFDTFGIQQVFYNALAGKRVSFSFLWALIGTTSVREDLKFKVILAGSNWYDLTEKGQWIPYDVDYMAVYKSQALPMDSGISDYTKFPLLTDNTPESGSILVYFYHYTPTIFDSSEATTLILTDIVMSTSAIELKTIKIQLTSENLVTSNQDDIDKIFWKNRKSTANFYGTDFDYDSITLNDFFDINGKPIDSMLSKLSDDNRLSITDILSFFQDQNSKSYKFELSKIDIFKCEKVSTKIKAIGKASKTRRFRAICEFSREEIWYQKVYDENDVLLPPESNSGWFNTGIIEANKYLWVRTPFNGIELPWVKGVIDTSTEFRTYRSSFVYTDKISSQKQYPTTPNSEIKIDNAIGLREIFRKVLSETHISLRGKKVYSSFLWNDPLSTEEEAIVYKNLDPDVHNYVTREKNWLNRILAIHTYELSTVATTDKDKTILKTGYNDLISDFLSYFPNCYWFMDSNKDWHFEHFKYFDMINVSKNLTEPKYDYLGQYQSCDYIKDKLYSLEQLEFKNSGYDDFYKAEITFDKIVSNKRGQDNKNSISSKILSTDVRYCIENRDSLDNGIVLVAYDEIEGENICRYGIGQKSHKSVINGDLSISSLLATFATYEGTWKEGKINNQGFKSNPTYEYKTTKYVRQGEEIKIKGIFLNRTIFTNLGLGLVSKRSVDYENEITKITALYRYEDNFDAVGENSNPIQGELPTLNTLTITSIIGSTVHTKVSILSDGGLIVTERGIVWSIGSIPTVLNNKVTNGSGIGTYNTNFNYGDEGTYYVRGYAINAIGVAYGGIKQFIIS